MTGGRPDLEHRFRARRAAHELPGSMNSTYRGSPLSTVGDYLRLAAAPRPHRHAARRSGLGRRSLIGRRLDGSVRRCKEPPPFSETPAQSRAADRLPGPVWQHDSTPGRSSPSSAQTPDTFEIPVASVAPPRPPGRMATVARRRSQEKRGTGPTTRGREPARRPTAAGGAGYCQQPLRTAANCLGRGRSTEFRIRTADIRAAERRNARGRGQINGYNSYGYATVAPW
jgi:hypothetical protein